MTVLRWVLLSLSLWLLSLASASIDNDETPGKMKIAFEYVAIEAAAEESMILNALSSLLVNGQWKSTAFVITDKPECFSNYATHLASLAAQQKEKQQLLALQGTNSSDIDVSGSPATQVVEDGFDLKIIHLDIARDADKAHKSIVSKHRKKMSFHALKEAKVKHIMRQIKVPSSSNISMR